MKSTVQVVLDKMSWSKRPGTAGLKLRAIRNFRLFYGIIASGRGDIGRAARKRVN